jgi:hypothetical protein
MNKFFAPGLYKFQLNIICAAVVFGVLFTAFKSNGNDQPLVKSSSASVPAHVCIDGTHQTCDGACECDGLGCSQAINQELQASQLTRDYQLELSDDFIVVYDGERVVGTLTYKTSLGRMMMKDNE